MDCNTPGFPTSLMYFELSGNFSSIQLLSDAHVAHAHFTQLLMSNSLWPRGLQYTRLPCPSPTPGAHSHSCPLSWWCHPTISSSVVPFSSCLQSFHLIHLCISLSPGNWKHPGFQYMLEESQEWFGVFYNLKIEYKNKQKLLSPSYCLHSCGKVRFCLGSLPQL